jgi:hypothetical protein
MDSSLAILTSTDPIAHYMQAKLKQLQSGHNELVPFPDHWPYELLLECDQAVRIVHEALNRRCKPNYSALYLGLY